MDLLRNFKKLKGIITLLLVLPLTQSIFSQTVIEETDWSQPLKKCWEYDPKERIIDFASDNEQLFILTKRNIRSINPLNGNLFWKSDLPGDSFGRIISGKKQISINFTKTDGSSESGNYAKNTGLPATKNQDISDKFSIINSFWKEYPSGNAPFLSVPKEPGEKDIRYKYYIKTLDPGLKFIIDNFGTLYIFKNEKKLNKNERPKPVGTFKKTSALFFDRNQILIGNRIGLLESFEVSDKTKFKKSWSYKTGGEILSIRRVGKSILVGSKDNFIYSFKSGKKDLQWKKKFAGRIISFSVIGNKFVYVVSQGSNRSFIIDLERGQIVNQIDFGNDIEFLNSNSQEIGNFILTNTNYGIISHSPRCQ